MSIHVDLNASPDSLFMLAWLLKRKTIARLSICVGGSAQPGRKVELIRWFIDHVPNKLASPAIVFAGDPTDEPFIYAPDSENIETANYLQLHAAFIKDLTPEDEYYGAKPLTELLAHKTPVRAKAWVYTGDHTRTTNKTTEAAVAFFDLFVTRVNVFAAVTAVGTVTNMAYQPEQYAPPGGTAFTRKMAQQIEQWNAATITRMQASIADLEAMALRNETDEARYQHKLSVVNAIKNSITQFPLGAVLMVMTPEPDVQVELKSMGRWETWTPSAAKPIFVHTLDDLDRREGWRASVIVQVNALREN